MDKTGKRILLGIAVANSFMFGGLLQRCTDHCSINKQKTALKNKLQRVENERDSLFHVLDYTRGCLSDRQVKKIDRELSSENNFQYDYTAY